MIDVLIIGSGIAGLRASIEAKKTSSSVLVLSKTKITSCGSVQAQGGINAVINSNEDTIDKHIEDTINSAKYCNKEAIKLMCKQAPFAIKFLKDIGVPFDIDNNNNFIKRKMGGSSYARTLHCNDYTGLKIVNSLYEKAINDGVEFYEYYKVIDLLIFNNIYYGVIVLNIKNSTLEIIKSKSLIIASGGYANIYNGYSTNANSNIGDMITIAYKNNLKISNLHKIQFHPTSLIKSKLLMSEAARAEGGYLINSDNKRFINELLPRDIVTLAVFEQIQNGKKVYIDLRHLKEKKINSLLPQEKFLCSKFEGVDIINELVEVTPSAHYTMGGISANITTQTSIKNIFACGECADLGLHGNNRLGGNSLLDAVVFGEIAGKNASNIINTIKYQNNIDFSTKLHQHNNYLTSLFEQIPTKNFYYKKKELGKMLFNNFGIKRTKQSIYKLKLYLTNLQNEIKYYGINDKNKIFNTDLIEFLEFQNMISLSIAMTNNTHFNI